ncbi:hypothetical protein [Xenorhabdus indica]|uniref:hypothetical protein n=1 Tax=Xenorhabdus indica TaxID=333964 RepID=UPI001656CCE0|nr:hypothetical protein [Xenorhabdus indica]MBC8945424.1 hypothetical protein [Xenorhabdus indica]
MNIENELLQKKKPDLVIVPSIASGSDVLPGQFLSVTITLTSASVLPDTINVKIIEDTNHTVSLIDQSKWNTIDQYSGSVTVKLQIDESLTQGKTATYTIAPIAVGVALPEAQPQSVSYNVKQLNGRFIEFSPEEKYIPTPVQENSISSARSQYITLSTTLNDIKGAAIKNLEILVSTDTLERLGRVSLATDEQAPKLITPQMIYGKGAFYIKSDDKGKISFRVYPKQHQPVRLDLDAEVVGPISPRTASTIYVVNLTRYLPTMAYPNILEAGEGGVLTQDLGGSNKFHVEIQSYPNYQDTDNIIFFIKDMETHQVKQLGKIRKLKSITNLDSYRFSFPYDDLMLNRDESIYYVIAPMKGELQYSDMAGLTYVGNSESSPLENISRVYDEAKVFSSYANANINVYTDNADELVDGDDIIITTINQQKQYIGDGSGEGVTGLYVTVFGTNDSNNTKLPKLGSSGHVNLYITSPTSRKNQQKYPFTLPSQVDQGQPTSHIMVSIPYCDLNRVAGPHLGGTGSLYFDYYTEDASGTKTYSKVWRANIDTVYPEQAEDDNDGCPPLPTEQRN